MPDRITWASFPRLRDSDVFDVVETSAPPDKVVLNLVAGPNVTWWKEIRFVDLATGHNLQAASTQDARHGPLSISLTSSQFFTTKLVIAKAKIFGIHTDMYELFELSEKAGREITLTWLADAPDNLWGQIGSFFSDIGNGIATAVTTVVQAVGSVVDAIGGAVANAVAWVGGLIEAIPGVGRVIALIVNGINAVVGWIVGLVSEAVTTVVGWFGVKRPTKLIRLQIVVQRDAFNNPVASLDVVRAHLAFLIELYEVRADIRVIPAAPTPLNTSAAGPVAPLDQYITILERPSAPDTLNVRCGGDAFTADFGTAGAEFQLMMNNLYWGNSRRAGGPGTPVVAFAVSTFSPTSTVGCSLGTTFEYVTVDFAHSTTQYSTLAHEVGHSCGLLHVGDANNLMNPISPSPTPPGDLRNWLTDGQVFLLRASPRSADV